MAPIASKPGIRPGVARDFSGIRILLTENDPYLAVLIERFLPDAEIIEGPPANGEERDDEFDLEIVRVHDSASLDACLASPRRVLVIADPRMAAESERALGSGNVLVPPVLPAEIRSALRAALSIPEESTNRRGLEEKLRIWAAATRVAAIALAAGLELTNAAIPRSRALVLTLSLAYVLLRTLIRRRSALTAATDIVLASLLVSATGGVASNYALFSLSVVLATGVDHGWWRGGLAGSIVGSAATSHLLSSHDRPLHPSEAAVWILLVSAVGVAAGVNSFFGQRGLAAPNSALREVNAMLASLYRRTRAMPGSLGVGVIASSVMAEIKDALGAHAAALVVSNGLEQTVIDAYGVENRDLLSHRGMAKLLERSDARVIRADESLLPLAEAFGPSGAIVVAPICRDGEPLGAILCATTETNEARTLAFVRSLAEEAGLGIENALLFARICQLSADEERARLARDLHDGAVQGVTHLRLELEMLAAMKLDPDSLRDEIVRLSRVGARTEREIRGLIAGLRAEADSEGLSGALRLYLREMAAVGGPTITFETIGWTRAHPSIEIEAFRIAQEALSNAMRHARGSSIRVSLSGDGDELRLLIEDDGLGFDVIRVRRGVGIDAMRERAHRMGGRITIGRGPQGGTKVDLVCPITVERAWESAG